MSLVSGSTVPYIATDQLLVDQIVYELKSQGIFDSFRKECIADVDTKPAYQNLRQRVEGSVSSFLKEQKWKPESNKNQLRDMLRKNIYESGFLETGVERIVNQVVNPKINTVFLPKVKEVFYKHIGLQTPAVSDFPDAEEETKTETEPQNLLPTDLEAISPENIQETAQEDSNSMAVDDDDTSPPFEPLDEDLAFKLIPMEENSIDSHLSGMSGLASHDSQHSNKDNMQQLLESDSQLSKNSSSDDRLSIVTDEASNTKVDMLVVTDGVVALETSDDNKDNIIELTQQETKAKVPIDDFEDKTIIKDELIILDVQIKQETPEEDAKTTLSSDISDSNMIKQDGTSSKHNSSHKKDSSRDNKKDSSRHHSTSKSRDKSRDSKDYRDSKDKSSKIKSATSSSTSTTKDISKSKSSSTSSSSNRHSSDKDKERISTTKKYSSSSSKDKDKSSTSITKDKSNGSSKDKSKDRDTSTSGSKDKYKDHSSKSSTSSSRDKSSSKDHSKSKSTDKSYKSEHRSSSTRKYSTSSTTETSKSHTPSSSNKDKRDKKENSTKDDHFSSKTQRNERRSTDRDSNDGQTKSKGGSTSNCSIEVLPTSEEQTNNNTTEDSSSNNSNSKDGSNSDCCQNGGGTKIVPDNGQTEIQQPVDLLTELQKQESKLLETVPENNDISLLETTANTTTTLMESASSDFVETLDAIKSHLAEYKPAEEPKEVQHIPTTVLPLPKEILHTPTEVLPIIKLPKFASNFREVRKIMKLRKQLKQQSKLRKLLLKENSTDSASTEQVNNKATICDLENKDKENTNHNTSLVLLEQDLIKESTASGTTDGTAKEELIKISNNDDCLYLDEVTDKTTRYLSYTSNFIDKLNNEVSLSTPNKVPITKRRGKKRKISTLSSDSSSTYNDITADQVSTSSILSRNTTLSPIATSTEINSTAAAAVAMTTSSSSSRGDAAAVTSATAHVHVVKQRRLTNTKATQRYTSDDLYKPRPFLKGTTKRTSGRVAN